jgi:hypothetical protein
MRTASSLSWISFAALVFATSLGAGFGCAADNKRDKKDAVAAPVESATQIAPAPAEAKAAPAPPDDPTLIAAAPAAKKPAPTPVPKQPSRAAAMKPGFQKAFTSFQEHAAAELGVAVEQLQAGPDGEDVKMPQTLGKAWAYTAIQKDVAGPRQIRGWATADGTVITPKQNLGALLKEAGVGGKKAKKPDEIAKAIAWGLGNDYALNLDPWPAITVDKTGAGTFVFAVDGREAGPGGAGGGPIKKLLVTIAIAADHSGTMTMAAQ